MTGGSNLGFVLHGNSSNVVVRGNDIYGNSNGIDITGGYAEAEVFDNITVEGNKVHDNGYRLNEQGYGMLLNSLTNSVVKNNLVYGNRVSGMTFYDANSGDTASSNTAIYQNLFYDPASGGGISISGPALSGISVRNNIFVQLSSTRAALSKNANVLETALSLNNNLYYSPNNATGRIVSYNGVLYTPAELAAATGKESAGTLNNPGFANESQFDFHLTSGSAAKGRGAAVGVAKDFDGSLRSTTAPSVGAFE
jgi:nitrous oxidase accessory protein NosD